MGADLVVGALDGRISRLRGRDGEPLWSKNLGAPLPSSPVPGPEPGTLLVAAGDGTLHALRAEDGAPLWRYAAGAPVAAAPVAADLDGDGAVEVAVASYDGRLHVLDAQGRRLWCWRGDGPILAAPRIADVDRDGAPDIVLAIGTERAVLAIHARAAEPRLPWPETGGSALRRNAYGDTAGGTGIDDPPRARYDRSDSVGNKKREVKGGRRGPRRAGARGRRASRKVRAPQDRVAPNGSRGPTAQAGGLQGKCHRE